jgi:hypothetical protein
VTIDLILFAASAGAYGLATLVLRVKKRADDLSVDIQRMLN